MSSRMRAAIICQAHAMRSAPTHSWRNGDNVRTQREHSTCHGHALPSPTNKIYINTHVAAGLILCLRRLMSVSPPGMPSLTHLYGQGKAQEQLVTAVNWISHVLTTS
jgi:hypothetical protein